MASSLYLVNWSMKTMRYLLPYCDSGIDRMSVNTWSHRCFGGGYVPTGLVVPPSPLCSGHVLQAFTCFEILSVRYGKKYRCLSHCSDLSYPIWKLFS